MGAYGYFGQPAEEREAALDELRREELSKRCGCGSGRVVTLEDGRLYCTDCESKFNEFPKRN